MASSLMSAKKLNPCFEGVAKSQKHDKIIIFMSQKHGFDAF
jgi:hypothetical protein